MRFDLITIFPDYFEVLDLSLVGRARQDQIVDIRVHNLRDWAAGKHRTVDDTPAGGGAGMVMRADVWRSAIESVREDGCVLAIPTPSGKPLSQRDLEELAGRPQVIVACGRYEGIDARLAEHYRRVGVEVFEFSLGDYVLNGGEVAALALVEGISRLVPGVVGNPESLLEESHGEEGLLEYPVYTHPHDWQGIAIPPVLHSGDHGRIRRWRRDQSLLRTARLRGDLTRRLLARRPSGLNRRDREVLALGGFSTGSSNPRFEVASDSDMAEVADFAGRTFPLACPPSTTEAEIADFISTNLSVEALSRARAAGARITVCRDEDGPIVAYALVEKQPPPGLESFASSACYISKFYVDLGRHGTGVAGALLEFCLADAVACWDPAAVILGTNRENRRAARFYRHHGFTKVGRRDFVVGGRSHEDFVFARDLTADPPLQ